MRFFIIVCILALLAACHKKNAADIQSPLIGGWVPESGPGGRMLVFSFNGELGYRQWDTVLSYPYTHFKIENDSVILFTGPNSSTSKNVSYRISGNILTLNGACVVNCTERFFRIYSID